MEILTYKTISELATISDAWDRLSEQELTFVPSFSELRYQLEAGGSKFRLLAAIENSQIIAIACFTYENATKSYQLATRKLFHLPVKAVFLFGSCVLGQPSENVIRKFFDVIIERSDFDVIDVGVIFVDSPLYNAITSLHHGFIAWSLMRKKHLRWLIRLPGSFDEYIASLPKRTRTHITRDCRKFEREAPDFRVMRLPEEVDIFLRDAEKISRLTYQWNLGSRLCNDESTHQEFIRLAKNGTLRCYIVYLRDKPCAFGWGELGHRTFTFHVTGYDPQYRKLSPGTALMMRMIRDLIENTNCEVFDFKWGSEDGYKSRLGNVSLSCARMQLARIYRPYSFLLVVLDKMINVAKNFVMNLVELIFGHGGLKQRLKSTLRRFGIAIY
jgi:hypothetical protein